MVEISLVNDISVSKKSSNVRITVITDGSSSCSILRITRGSCKQDGVAVRIFNWWANMIFLVVSKKWVLN